MKKAIILLALLVSGVSISQDIHAITYLDVPRSAAADFIRLHKKFVDFLLRKGYETSLIYEKLRELEAGS